MANNNKDARYEVSDVIELQTEQNYSIVSDSIDIYNSDYSFPFKPGDTFPPQSVRDRANICKTNELLYKNRYDDVFKHYIKNFNVNDLGILNTSYRIICGKLPYFRTVTDTFVNLLCSKEPIIGFNCDIKDEVKYSGIINSTNIQGVIRDSVKNTMMTPASLYIVKHNKSGKNVVQSIPCKNFIIYNDPEDITSIYSYLTFNISDDNVQFIEYLYDGTITKRVFEYKDGTLGRKVGEDESTQAFGGLFKEAPCVLIPNNISNIGDSYGTDKFYDFSSAVIAVIRSFANMLKLGDKNMQIMFKAPDDIIQRNNNGLGNIMINRGVVGYQNANDRNAIPEYQFLKPELAAEIEATISLYKKAIDTLASASGISKVFFDFEFAGSKTLSGEALKTMMIGTIMNANMLINKNKDYYRDIISKLLKLSNNDVNNYDIAITFKDIVEASDKEKSEYVNTRIDNGTMSKIEAIMFMDNISRIDAVNKYKAIISENKLLSEINNINEDVEDDNSINNTDNLEFNNLDNTSNDVNNKVDDNNGLYYEDVPYVQTHESYSNLKKD